MNPSQRKQKIVVEDNRHSRIRDYFTYEASYSPFLNSYDYILATDREGSICCLVKWQLALP